MGRLAPATTAGVGATLAAVCVHAANRSVGSVSALAFTADHEVSPGFTPGRERDFDGFVSAFDLHRPHGVHDDVLLPCFFAALFTDAHAANRSVK